ncbi:hypothetical protein DVH24_018054 [Malus domestica]|uniref:NB-ARC domain-containing protein n=1 Tax=Malus domestica TaxID=3750 RepID=A0A498KK65_MALDO|nr:hypothetical protein DVH24_018054 [Malus domestica]
MIEKALTRVMTEPFMNRPSIYSPLWESQVSIGGREAIPNLTVAVGNLTSLTELETSWCENLMYLPTVEAMQCLTKLHKLEIQRCPHLKERWTKDGA